MLQTYRQDTLVAVGKDVVTVFENNKLWSWLRQTVKPEVLHTGHKLPYEVLVLLVEMKIIQIRPILQSLPQSTQSNPCNLLRSKILFIIYIWTRSPWRAG